MAHACYCAGWLSVKGRSCISVVRPTTLGERVGKIISSFFFFFCFLISKGCLVLTDKN